MKIDEEIKKFRNEIKIWSKRLKVFPYEIKIQKMKTWGHCSLDGMVCFNSDLLFKRKELKTYVIVHELLHLRIPNHNRLFYATLVSYIPDWRERDRELNFSFGFKCLSASPSAKRAGGGERKAKKAVGSAGQTRGNEKSSVPRRSVGFGE